MSFGCGGLVVLVVLDVVVVIAVDVVAAIVDVNVVDV